MFQCQEQKLKRLWQLCNTAGFSEGYFIYINFHIRLERKWRTNLTCAVFIWVWGWQVLSVTSVSDIFESERWKRQLKGSPYWDLVTPHTAGDSVQPVLAVVVVLLQQLLLLLTILQTLTAQHPADLWECWRVNIGTLRSLYWLQGEWPGIYWLWRI